MRMRQIGSMVRMVNTKMPDGEVMVRGRGATL